MTSKIYINEKCRIKKLMNRDSESVYHRRFLNDWSQDAAFTMVTASGSISTKQSDGTFSATCSVHDSSDSTTGTLSTTPGRPTSRRSKRKYEVKEHYTRSKKSRVDPQEAPSDVAKASPMMDESSTHTKQTQTTSNKYMEPNSPWLPKVVTILHPWKNLSPDKESDDDNIANGYEGDSYKLESGDESHSEYSSNVAYVPLLSSTKY
jgi:hypothetical protein